MLDGDPAEHHYAPAYSFGQVYFRADTVVAVAARTRHTGHACTYVRAGNAERLVIGTAEHVLAKVRSALPYCRHEAHVEENEAGGTEMAEPWQ